MEYQAGQRRHQRREETMSNATTLAGQTDAATSRSLYGVVSRLVRLVGKRPVKDILEQFGARIEGWPNRKTRLKIAKTLCVLDESEADGG